jgi:hypothetical protein
MAAVAALAPHLSDCLQPIDQTAYFLIGEIRRCRLAEGRGIGQVVVNAALRMSLGRGPQGCGVHNVRGVCVAACLAAGFSLIHIPDSLAGSTRQVAPASYQSSASAPVSRAADTVPANCIRESCGKLFCWNTRGGR